MIIGFKILLCIFINKNVKWAPISFISRKKPNLDKFLFWGKIGATIIPFLIISIIVFLHFFFRHTPDSYYDSWRQFSVTLITIPLGKPISLLTLWQLFADSHSQTWIQTGECYLLVLAVWQRAPWSLPACLPLWSWWNRSLWLALQGRQTCLATFLPEPIHPAIFFAPLCLRPHCSRLTTTNIQIFSCSCWDFSC